MTDFLIVGSNAFFQGGNATVTGTGNLSVGLNATSGLTTGNYNTGLGEQALRDVTDGSYNTGIGLAAGRAFVSGRDNTLFGASAERANVTGTGNVTIGNSAGIGRTQGDYNTCVGTGAMSDVVTGGGNNVAVGRSALLSYPGDDAVAIGSYALSQATGDRNIGIGARAGRAITTGLDNVVLGFEAATSPQQKVDAVNTIALGRGAATTADNQISLGDTSMREVLFGGESFLKWRPVGPTLYLGRSSGNFDSSGQACLAIGTNALKEHTTGGHLVAIGHETMRNATAPGSVVAIGSYSCMSAQTLTDCVAVGFDTLREAASGVGATAVGHFALQHATEAGRNTAIGDSALRFTNTGADNTAVGYVGMDRNLTGSFNISVGAGAATYRTSGDSNIHIGYSANQGANAQEFSGGNRNIGIGEQALLTHVGDDVVAVGHQSGRSLTTASTSVFLGANAGNNDGQRPGVVNSVAIGANTFTSKDNQVVIGDDCVDELILAGVTVTKAQLEALIALLA